MVENKRRYHHERISYCEHHINLIPLEPFNAQHQLILTAAETNSLHYTACGMTLYPSRANG
jgi:hypothetical protein